MANLSDLKIAVAHAPTVRESGVLLLQGLASALLGTAGSLEKVEDLARSIGAQAEELATALSTNTPVAPTAGLPAAAETDELEPPTDAQGLRLDGPTLKEWTDRGYPATSYPPAGYASKEPPVTTNLNAPQVEPTALVFRTDADGESSNAFITTPWPAVASTPRTSIEGETPLAKLDGQFLTFYAANGRATYTVRDAAADPLVLDLQPDSSTYSEAPAVP